jgi:hypothetical protein
MPIDSDRMRRAEAASAGLRAILTAPTVAAAEHPDSPLDRDRRAAEIAFEAGIDLKLGADFPEARRARLRQARADMAGRREALLMGHAGGRVSRERLRQGVQGLVDGMMRDVAAILTDEEFLKYAGVRKGMTIELPAVGGKS